MYCACMIQRSWDLTLVVANLIKCTQICVHLALLAEVGLEPKLHVFVCLAFPSLIHAVYLNSTSGSSILNLIKYVISLIMT